MWLRQCHAPFPSPRGRPFPLRRMGPVPVLFFTCYVTRNKKNWYVYILHERQMCTVCALLAEVRLCKILATIQRLLLTGFECFLCRTCKECYWLGIDRTRWARTVYSAGLGREYTVPCSAVPEDDWRGRIGALCEPSSRLMLLHNTLTYMRSEAWQHWDCIEI